MLSAGDNSDLSWVELRKRYEEFGAATPTAPDIERTSVMIGAMAAEWSKPKGADETKVILYLHGGGYVIGSLKTHRAMVGEFARDFGGLILAIDYRLGPEDPFPAAVEDALAAYKFLLAQSFKPQRIIISGDSAGGGLTLALLMAIRDAGLAMPAGGWCISPWADLTCSGDTMALKAEADSLVNKEVLLKMADGYLNGADPAQPAASPVFGSYAGLPPVLIQVGSAETLLDDSVAVARACGLADVPVTLEIWPHMIHVWHFFCGLIDEGKQAIKVGAGWCNRQLS
jgi:acetyl esterase/lipase